MIFLVGRFPLPYPRYLLLDHVVGIPARFLEVTRDELQEVRDAHPFCGTCMKEGLHVTLKYGAVEEWNDVAIRRIGLPNLPAELEPDRRGRLGRLADKVRRALTDRSSAPAR